MDSLDDYQIPYGLMAEFDTPADAMHAAEQAVSYTHLTLPTNREV